MQVNGMDGEIGVIGRVVRDTAPTAVDPVWDDLLWDELLWDELADGDLMWDQLADGDLGWDQLADGEPGRDQLAEPTPPFDPERDLRVAAGVGPTDPIDQAVTAMRAADREMATVLRGFAAAGPAGGLPARRHIALRAQATGVDVGFLDRAVQTLQAMPATWAAFDDARISWSQLRGIILEARRLSVARRQVLDGLLAVVIDQQAEGEPDRLVETCGDLVGRLDRDTAERDEASVERAERLWVQLGVDGWGQIHGDLAPDTLATVCDALDAAADAPVAADGPPVTDDDGRVLPKALQPVGSRARQWAEALHRIATSYLAGESTGRARPSMVVVASLADLADLNDADDVDIGTTSVVSRLLLRTGTGRRRITRALTRRLAEDADLIPLFTDADGIPVAIGDRHAPISEAIRRAVLARDQGCRAPGCAVPAMHCDLHHVIPRHQGGETSVANLTTICRRDHTTVTRHRWQMRMDPDGTLHTRIGRHTYTTRPRLTPPPAQRDRGGPAAPRGDPDIPF